MAKIVFDQPKDLVEPVKPSAKPPVRAGDSRTAPGPEIDECVECGAQSFPQWIQGRDIFCRRCVPDSLRHPDRSKP